MSTGSDAMRNVYAKLDWATTKHGEMYTIFEKWLKPGGGDDRPCGIRWRTADRPTGLTVARFTVDEPLPDSMTMLAADVVHNARSALDQVLARLKDHFGGDAGKGHFPVRKTEKLWQDHVI